VRRQLVGDLHPAVAAGGVDDDRNDAGIVIGGDAGIRDALAPLSVEHEPDGALAVSIGFEDGAWLGVVGGRSCEAGLPSTHPVLFAARGEQAKMLRAAGGLLECSR
jgi:hypothetical protein